MTGLYAFFSALHFVFLFFYFGGDLLRNYTEELSEDP